MKQPNVIFYTVILFTVALGLGTFVASFDPFDPVLLTQNEGLKQRPDLNSVNFAKQISKTLEYHDELHVRIGSVAFVKNSLANNELLRANYTDAAEVALREK